MLQDVCKSGHLGAAGGDVADPLPDVIRIYRNEPSKVDLELGARILFMNAYFEGNQQFRRDWFIKDWRGVTWLPREQFDKLGLAASKAIYLDSQWACLAEDAPGGIYYSSRFPIQFAAGRKQVY